MVPPPPPPLPSTVRLAARTARTTRLKRQAPKLPSLPQPQRSQEASLSSAKAAAPLLAARRLLPGKAPEATLRSSASKRLLTWPPPQPPSTARPLRRAKVRTGWRPWPVAERRRARGLFQGGRTPWARAAGTHPTTPSPARCGACSLAPAWAAPMAGRCRSGIALLRCPPPAAAVHAGNCSSLPAIFGSRRGDDSEDRCPHELCHPDSRHIVACFGTGGNESTDWCGCAA